KYQSMFISTALAVFLTGVTEPFEYMFMFSAIPLYIVYSVIQGLAFASAGVLKQRLHSFGSIELFTRLPMSFKAGLGWDVLNFVLMCILFFAIGYFVAYFMIGKFKYATPGRLGNYSDIATDMVTETGEETKVSTTTITTTKTTTTTVSSQAEAIIELLGGRENIELVDACMTRLRVTVKDPEKVAEIDKWRENGALGLFKKGNGIQAVYGPKADILKSDINDIL
ncbi:MAG: PTS transporter subunit EIIB, partial [Clostridia bacterium]|nr:PTS transporter subunit EIIB [Clostridia bacterium]